MSSRGCKDKMRYRDETSALLSASKRMKLGFEKLRVYECNRCHRWHLTSKPKTIVNRENHGS